MPVSQNAGLLDNTWLLVLLYTMPTYTVPTYTMPNLPIAVWMMRSFLAEVPVSIPEAASIDGAGLISVLPTSSHVDAQDPLVQGLPLGAVQ